MGQPDKKYNARTAYRFATKTGIGEPVYIILKKGTIARFRPVEGHLYVDIQDEATPRREDVVLETKSFEGWYAGFGTYRTPQLRVSIDVATPFGGLASITDKCIKKIEAEGIEYKFM